MSEEPVAGMDFASFDCYTTSVAAFASSVYLRCQITRPLTEAIGQATCACVA
jgi:hypothetical protein